jgi:hypothetical protein
VLPLTADTVNSVAPVKSACHKLQRLAICCRLLFQGQHADPGTGAIQQAVKVKGAISINLSEAVRGDVVCRAPRRCGAADDIRTVVVMPDEDLSCKTLY